MNDPLERWRRATEEAYYHVEVADFEDAGDTAIAEAERLLALARELKGVVCHWCGGFGHRGYGSTATWRGGVGGQVVTQDVCDKCWGTGRSDRTGVNLRLVGPTPPESE